MSPGHGAENVEVHATRPDDRTVIAPERDVRTGRQVHLDRADKNRDHVRTPRHTGSASGRRPRSWMLVGAAAGAVAVGALVVLFATGDSDDDSSRSATSPAATTIGVAGATTTPDDTERTDVTSVSAPATAGNETTAPGLELPPLDTCSIVGAADAEELFGAPVTSAQDVAGCGFDATVAPVRRLLVLDGTASGTSDEALRSFAELFSHGGTAEAVAGVGEAAFATPNSIAFRKSGYAVLVYAGSSQTVLDPARFIDLARRIADRV